MRACLLLQDPGVVVSGSVCQADKQLNANMIGKKTNTIQ